jgi:CHAT domain-containing protein
MHAVERVRGNLTSGSLRTSYAADRASVYGDLVVALLRLGQTNEAFAIADAARGRALLEHIAAAGRAIARTSGAGADLVRAEQLLRRIDQLVDRLRVADTPTPRRRSIGAGDEAGFLTQELATARHDYETLMQRASVADHRVAAFVAEPRPSGSADHVRAVLRSDEAMLEYFVSRERLIIFVVTHSGVRSIDVPVGEDALFTRVRLARDLTTRLNASADARGAVLRGLFDILVAPARAAGLLAGAHTLVVVPHASLAYLPFAALIDRASGQYLVEQYAVLLSPSAASLAAVARRAWRKRPVSGKRVRALPG